MDEEERHGGLRSTRALGEARGDLAELERQVASGAGLAIIADEAVRTADLAGLARWYRATTATAA